jgi:hypothetical protein
MVWKQGRPPFFLRQIANWYQSLALLRRGWTREKAGDDPYLYQHAQGGIRGNRSALYTVAWHEDNKHITEVSNPRVIETSYRSPQLTRLHARPRRVVAFQEA